MSDAPPPSSRPASRREDALTVVKRLRDAGHVAYFAGGCVRDLLLGLQPKDYDVATDAPPDAVRAIFRNTQAVGAAFGVILVRLGGSQIEVATFRADMEYDDGRHPVGVRFTSAEEDSKRRDFTINGLFLDPISNQVIDYVGGQEDLRQRVIRAIGDPEARFREDHLRLLRAIRFAARMEFQIEPQTGQAIRHHAPHLTRISPERVADELRLMLTRYDAAWAWHAMTIEYPGLSEVVFRFAGTVPPAADRSGLNILGIGPEETWPFALSLAAISVEWSMFQNRGVAIRQIIERSNVHRLVRALRQSLRISNEEADDMKDTLEGVAILLSEPPLRVGTLKRFLQRRTANLSRTLLQKIVCHIGPPVLADLNALLEKYANADFAPSPFITGDDLTAAGLKPGKLFKRVLDDVYDAQLEDRVRSKDEAMTLALQIAKSTD